MGAKIMRRRVRILGHRVIVLAEDIGLLIIALATLVAVGFELMHMINARTVTLADLLLLFIYLEVLAMVAAYLESGKLPVRMPLYIAMVALARYMILDMKNLDSWRLIGIAAALLVIALAVLVLRFGHSRYPYPESDS
ncbi:MAG: phosphate-starvation-inducible PsiE family protein [Gammaproteobacteria bacterium]|nr:phosphate-starvation-inducible PsiE family protein [Gammaproteobacteria bacterium]